jgi:putative hemolysin
MKTLTFLGAVLTLISLNSWAGPSITSGMGAPQAFCAEVHANFYDVSNDDYSWRLCALDGLIESATLQTHSYHNPTLAVKAYSSKRKRLPIDGTEKPASRYCTATGGQSLAVTGSDEAKLRVCLYKDDSMMEEWTLYYGEYSEKNVKLTDILTKLLLYSN